MSNSESESSVKSIKKQKCTTKTMSEVKELNQDETFAYIEKLHEWLAQKEKKLKKYKNKIKKMAKQLKVNSKAKAANGSDETVQETTKDPTTNSDDTATAAVEEDNNEMSAAAAFSFVDEIKQAAQRAQNLNDFEFEPCSGLYYDRNSGYYYNAEYGLYYDGNTGCYYSYNETKHAFEFHSQVAVQPTQTTADDNDNKLDDGGGDDEVEFDEWGGVITDKAKLQQIKSEKQKLKEEKDQKYKKRKNKNVDDEAKEVLQKHKKRRVHKRSHSNSGSEDENRRCGTEVLEEGELSTSSESCSDGNNSDEKHKKVAVFKSHGRFQDIAKKYPPSLRIIVQETNLDELKVGSLNLITYKGGTLGREGNHDVLIPDKNVSKLHLKFNYCHKESVYKCIDMGSRNGTILNGSQMTAKQDESEPFDLVHGSVLQVGQTKLLCHVHEGNSTCGLCEPGLLIAETAREVPSTTAVTLSHKEQLKMLQKKYGLEKEKFVEVKQSNPANYNDRAATRRVKVGSSSDKQKTQQANVNTAISSENKGFKMLSKLGWSKGEALGKSTATGGLLEPINVTSNTGTKGLGCSDPTAGVTVAELSQADKRKLDNWKKTMERYQKADIFEESDDEDDAVKK